MHLGIAAQGGPSRDPGSEAVNVVFVDVDTDVKFPQIAEDHQGLRRRRAHVFARPNVDLQDVAVNRGTDQSAVQVGLDHIDLSAGLFHGRSSNGLVFVPSARLEQLMLGLHLG